MSATTETLTVRQVAERLGWPSTKGSDNRVGKLIKAGALPGAVKGRNGSTRRWEIPLSAVDDFIATGQPKRQKKPGRPRLEPASKPPSMAALEWACWQHPNTRTESVRQVSEILYGDSNEAHMWCARWLIYDKGEALYDANEKLPTIRSVLAYKSVIHPNWREKLPRKSRDAFGFKVSVAV